ncbi:hypothetical protein GCM10018772_02000 [Streptomyces fumanus]|uniref:Uncharacterized protein n=2 Tax=Streptomyces fumanus TaxID=67302 RepID=A0A919A1F9_9ACTN|nr:hypothetical protein GCM10018772_02000 [Streptomyces fumanus]
MIVGIPLLFAYAQLPMPVGYYFFPLTFLTLLALYLPLALRWRELFAHVAGFAFGAALSLAGTVTALVTHSVGWTLAVVVAGPFAVMTVLVLFVLPVVGAVKRRRGRT